MILLCAALIVRGLRSVGTKSVFVRRLNWDVRDLITQGLLIMDFVKRVRWTFDALDAGSVLRWRAGAPTWRAARSFSVSDRPHLLLVPRFRFSFHDGAAFT